jgi:hypothetical protein
MSALYICTYALHAKNLLELHFKGSRAQDLLKVGTILKVTLKLGISTNLGRIFSKIHVLYTQSDRIYE